MESTAEIERIRAVYRQYAKRGYANSKWSNINKGNSWAARERQQKLRKLLESTAFSSLRSAHILDVGCGTGELLEMLRGWGAQSKNLCGVDLIPDRIRIAQQNFCDIRFELGNAESLPFAVGSFDLVTVFTLFSSILDRKMALNISREIIRVLVPKGAVLWYDFRINNPFNNNVHGVSRKAIEALFPQFKITVESISLVPALARRLGRLTNLLYPLLSSLPFLRSHLIGLLEKP